MANSDRRGYMPEGGRPTRPGGPTPGGSLAEAKEYFREQAQVLHQKYSSPLFVSGKTETFYTPVYETEVAIQFIDLVRSGLLPGYKIYGVPAMLILDGMFDYELSKSPATEYHPESNPLGVRFGSRENIRRTDQWLEYKINLDQLLDNFEASEGASKKWFETVDLLVCLKVDDQIEGYVLDEISEVNSGDRAYFGATHVLTRANSQHMVQVICLEKLRSLINSN